MSLSAESRERRSSFWVKTRRAAALIYAHLQKEFGFSVKQQLVEPFKDTSEEISLEE
jgi:hypothetical protein